jgi:hypothetical protein
MQHRQSNAREARPRYLVLLAIAAASCFGCGRSTLEVAPVRGKVLLDNRPLTKGGVVTLPLAGRGAHGTIQPDGTFELTTYHNGDGALLGQHKVAVAAYEGEELGPEADRGKLLVPKHYTSPESSGLTIKVTADGPNEPVLELSSK